MDGVSTLDEIKQLLRRGEINSSKLAIEKVANLCGNYHTDKLLEYYLKEPDEAVAKELQSEFMKQRNKFSIDCQFYRYCELVSNYFGWLAKDRPLLRLETVYVVRTIAVRLRCVIDIDDYGYNHDSKITEIMNKLYPNVNKQFVSICDIDGIVIETRWI